MTGDVTNPTGDPRFVAAYDMLGRSGASEVQLRYQDDEEPTVWMAVGTWRRDGQVAREVAASLNPLGAILRLLEQVMDGAVCVHCHRPSGIDIDRSPSDMPMSEVVCWYQFDPELKSFRRGCEGEAEGDRR